MLGNIMEFYDFVIYGYLFSYISHNFFPSKNEIISLLLTFGAFAGGYLTRPVGSIIFGHIGDKKGRKLALIYSITLISVATFLMGVLPTYYSIGILAPIVLTLLRLLQGIAVSGEQAGAIIYAAEFYRLRKLGLISSLMLTGILVGVFLGCFSVFFCQVLLIEQQMFSWGWRIPFLLAVILGIVAFKLRLDLIESPVFSKIKHKAVKIPLFNLVHTNSLANSFRMFVLSIVFAVPMSFHNVYLPVFYTKASDIGLTKGLFLCCCGIVWMAILLPIIGNLSEKLGYKQTVIYGCLLLLIFGYPLSLLLEHKTLITSIMVEILLGSIITIITAPLFAIFVQNFSPEIRYTGIAFTFNLGMAFFASLTPIVSISLEQYVIFPEAIGILLCCTALIGLFSLDVKYNLIKEFFMWLVNLTRKNVYARI
jgi:MHS family proline/betaine transporter-like MFS transporter